MKAHKQNNTVSNSSLYYEVLCYELSTVQYFVSGYKN